MQPFDTKRYNEKSACRLFCAIDRQGAAAPKARLEQNKRDFLAALDRLKHGGGRGIYGQQGDGTGTAFNIQRHWMEAALPGLTVPDNAILLVTAHENLDPTLEPGKLRYNLLKDLIKTTYAEPGREFDIIGHYEEPTNKEFLGSNTLFLNTVLAWPKGVDEEEMYKRLFRAGSGLRNRLARRGLGVDDLNILSASPDFQVLKGTVLPENFVKAFPNLNEALLTMLMAHIRKATGVKPSPASAHTHNGIAGTIIEMFNGDSTTYQANSVKATSLALDGENNHILVLPGLTDTAQQAASHEYKIRHLNYIPEETAMYILNLAYYAYQNLTNEQRTMLELGALKHTPWNGPSGMTTYANGVLTFFKDPLQKRPQYFASTEDRFMLCSEPGVLPMLAEDIIQHGEVRHMISFDTKTNTVRFERELLEMVEKIGRERNGESYAEVAEERILQVPGIDLETAAEEALLTPSEHSFARRAVFYGHTTDDYGIFILPEARTGKSLIMSQGADAQEGALRQDEYARIQDGIAHTDSKVFRPPISAQLYERLMDTTAYIGPNINVDERFKVVKTGGSILKPGELEQVEEVINNTEGLRFETFNFNADKGDSVKEALEKLADEVVEAVRSGVTHVNLSDRIFDETKYALSPLVAAAYVQRQLQRTLMDDEQNPDKTLKDSRSLDNQCCLIVDSGQILEEVHAEALTRLANVVGVNRFMVPEVIKEELTNNPGSFEEGQTLSELVANEHKAVIDGVKTLRGIGCIIHGKSAVGSRMTSFEGINMEDPFFKELFGPIFVIDRRGDDRQLTDGISGNAGGNGVDFFEKNARSWAENAFGKYPEVPTSGLMAPKEDGIPHGMNPNVVTAIFKVLERYAYDRAQGQQGYRDGKFVDRIVGGEPPDEARRPFKDEEIGNYERSEISRDYEERILQINEEAPTRLSNFIRLAQKRDEDGNPIRVERTKEERAALRQDILNRIFGGNMSLQALTELAHKTIAEGQRMLDSWIGTGEGSLDDARLMDFLNVNNDLQLGTRMHGVTPRYVTFAAVLLQETGKGRMNKKEQQGAKATGGIAPPDKVYEDVAFRRRVNPFTAIHAPYHMTPINSIEENVWFFKMFALTHPDMKVDIKFGASHEALAAAMGAAKFLSEAGVAKSDGKTGSVNIACTSGGTAASKPNTSFHTITRNERAVKETRTAFDESGYHYLTNIRASGNIHSASDAMAYFLLGANETEIGWFFMNLVKCSNIRKCKIEGGCVTGVANNEKAFDGDARDVARFILDIVCGLEEMLTEKGWTDLDEVIGNPKAKKIHKWAREQYEDLIEQNKDWLEKESARVVLSEEEQAELKERFRKKEILDDQYMDQLKEAVENNRTMEVEVLATNEDHVFGAKLHTVIDTYQIMETKALYDELEALEEEIFGLNKAMKEHIAARRGPLYDEVRAAFGKHFGDFKISAEDLGEAEAAERTLWLNRKQREADMTLWKEIEGDYKDSDTVKQKIKEIQALNDKITEAWAFKKEDSYVFNVKGVYDRNQPDTLGSVGHNFGCFATGGMTINIDGHTGDAVGWGMGTNAVIAINPSNKEKSVRVGKHAFAYATGGKAFVNAPLSAEAFTCASGLEAVCEGVGDFSMHFVTDGFVLDLGLDPQLKESGVMGEDVSDLGYDIGTNSTGLFYVRYDPEQKLKEHVDGEYINVHNLSERAEFVEHVTQMLEQHVERTNSPHGKARLEALKQNPEQEIAKYSVGISHFLEQYKDQQLNTLERVNLRRREQDGPGHRTAQEEWLEAEFGRRGIEPQAASRRRYHREEPSSMGR